MVRFAHPVERELLRVFDDLGVRWEYEPHTFVLERHADGSVHQAFTGFVRACASRRESGPKASSVATALPPRPRAASSRPGVGDLVASTI